ncbi:MAG: decaprenyl-phosphate phosphoribosyltransferase, partial [Actinomycetota bacterium]
MTAALVRAMRPRQWAKNVLVFGAPGAAGVLDDGAALGRTLLVFVAFCLAASGTYLWNDLLDRESDRRHPDKRHRPIASGALPVGVARIAGSVLLGGSLGVAAATGRWQTVGIVGLYVVVTLLYSTVLKHVAVLDIVTIASGFVLRAAGGAVAVDVPMSRWFVLVVTFGSLFVVTGKRYAELQQLGGEAETRATLSTYTPGYLRMLLSVSLGGAVISYCVWAFESSEEASATDAGSASDLPIYEATIVPIVIALFRYLLVLERGEGSAPEDVFLSDRVLQLAGAIWVV